MKVESIKEEEIIPKSEEVEIKKEIVDHEAEGKEDSDPQENIVVEVNSIFSD